MFVLSAFTWSLRDKHSGWVYCLLSPFFFYRLNLDRRSTDKSLATFERKYIWGFDVCLSRRLGYNLCLVQTYSAHLTLYRAVVLYKNLHDAFMDPLYIVYRRSVIVALFSVLLLFFFLVRQDWLYYPIIFLSLSYWLLCLWCFCAVTSLYDANNAFIFYISLVIKKLFHAVYSRTHYFFPLFEISQRVDAQRALLTVWSADVQQWLLHVCIQPNSHTREN